MNIYVANISSRASEDDLRALFEQYGDVSSVKIVIDKVTNRSRGFAFVEMADSDSGKQAIQELNGHHFMDKNLIVNEARPKTDNSRERYGNRGGGGGNKRW